MASEGVVRRPFPWLSRGGSRLPRLPWGRGVSWPGGQRSFPGIRNPRPKPPPQTQGPLRHLIPGTWCRLPSMASLGAAGGGVPWVPGVPCCTSPTARGLRLRMERRPRWPPCRGWGFRAGSLAAGMAKALGSGARKLLAGPGDIRLPLPFPDAPHTEGR